MLLEAQFLWTLGQGRTETFRAGAGDISGRKKDVEERSRDTV
jgi:hypothetical protein